MSFLDLDGSGSAASRFPEHCSHLLPKKSPCERNYANKNVTFFTDLHSKDGRPSLRKCLTCQELRRFSIFGFNQSTEPMLRRSAVVATCFVTRSCEETSNKSKSRCERNCEYHVRTNKHRSGNPMRYAI